MIQFFKYYYFRMFSYFSDGSSIPIFRTFSIMFVFAYFNLLTFSILIFSVGFNVKLTLQVGSGITWFWPVIFIVPLFALFYHRLKWRGLHDLIFKEYSNETKKEKTNGGWTVVTYFISSMLFFVLALWLRQVVRGY